MREKWNKTEASQESEGQPVGHQISIFPDNYRPKLLTKVPSIRGINTYNSIRTDTEAYDRGYDNLSFTPETDFTTTSSDYSFNTSSLKGNGSMVLRSLDSATPIRGIIYPYDDAYDYATVRSASSHTLAGSEGERRDDQSSTCRLVTSSSPPSSCWSWFACAEIVLGTISLAGGLGNLYRLPQTTLLTGGLPFLVAYAVLCFLVGLPLIFLELGLGQLSQEGFTKIWRAVPLIRGVGYVKFVAGCMLGTYYPLYMGLFTYYIVWLSKGPPPFIECASVRITENGYKADGIPAEECLNKTFLASPMFDPKWYGIYAGFLFIIWMSIAFLLIKRTKSYIKSLVILVIPILACTVALVVKSVKWGMERNGLERLVDEADWTLLTTSSVWYHALIQVFFSTNVGFGTFVTNAGSIFSKTNIYSTAIGYIIINLTFGVFSVILYYSFAGANLPKAGDMKELHLLSLIYNVSKEESTMDSQIWTIVIYCLLLFSGFVSMVTIVYTLLKGISIETNKKWQGWQVNFIFTFAGFLVGSIILLLPQMSLIHLADHYIVGNLVLLTTIVELLSFICFYGFKRIRLDFEFILGSSLPKLWIFLWWCLPLILLGILTWGLSTDGVKQFFKDDPVWLYATGLSFVLIALVFIIAMACYQIYQQDEYYTLNDKMKAVTKPSRKWGPVDPIMRYSWVQWHSKAKDGERDFTLKRRGTRDYTHSVKKRRDRTLASTESNTSTLSRSSPSYTKHDLNGSNCGEAISTNSTFTPKHFRVDNGIYAKPLRVMSLVDTLDPPPYEHPKNYGTYSVYKTNLNPLSNNAYESSTSDGYRNKGPYVIPDGNPGHVCYRKYGDNELSTEL